MTTQVMTARDEARERMGFDPFVAGIVKDDAAWNDPAKRAQALAFCPTAGEVRAEFVAVRGIIEKCPDTAEECQAQFAEADKAMAAWRAADAAAKDAIEAARQAKKVAEHFTALAQDKHQARTDMAGSLFMTRWSLLNGTTHGASNWLIGDLLEAKGFKMDDGSGRITEAT